MKSMNLVLKLLPIIGLLLQSGCSDDNEPGVPQADSAAAVDQQTSDTLAADTTAPPKAYGASCQKPEECKDKTCVEGFCSKPCKSLSDCPTEKGQAFDCAKETTLNRVVCYPKKYSTEPMTTGHDCSLDGTCAEEYSCLGTEGSADRYCSQKCDTDHDCPPRYRCATTRVGTADPEKWCRRRTLCHPCDIDDQCGGTDTLCLTDINGQGYCSKSCSKTGSTCPVFAKCEDAGNGKMACKHRKGYCFKSFDAEGGLCDPCIIHGQQGSKDIVEDGICQEDAHCFLLSQYTMEAICLTPCDGNGECPKSTTVEYGCFTFKSYDNAKLCLPFIIDPDYGEPVPDTCYPKR